MSYFLIAAIIFAIVAVLYVWYITRGLNSIDDNAVLPLESDEDKLLKHWYKANMQQVYDFNVNDVEIAAKYLQRIYNIEINPGLLVVGKNLISQYYALTHSSLSYEYRPNADCIFDLRSSLAKEVEVAIIHSDRVRHELQRHNSGDLTEVSLIMNSDLDGIAHEFISNVLKFRWEQIDALHDPNVLNHEGSYLYYRSPEGTRPGTTVTILDKVNALVIPFGPTTRARVNLLCSNYEFEALIRRWKHHLTAAVQNTHE